MFQTIDDLDAAATLRRAEGALGARRAAEIEDLELVAHWADLHGDEPVPRTVNGHRVPGGDRLVQLGGEGTPEVRELCTHELAVARGTHPLSTRAAMADVLDLRHRLPRCWMVFRAGDCDAWVVRRVASMSRHLTRAQAAQVDDAVAEVLPSQSPGRVLDVAEKAIIAADPAGHARRIEEALRRRYVGVGPSDEDGLRMVFARIEAGDATWIDALVDRLADILLERPELRADLTADLPDRASKDELRAIAFGLLAHPEEVLDLVAAADRASTSTQQPTQQPARRPHRRKRRNRAVVYIHLSQEAVEGIRTAVATVEDIGAMLLDQVRRLVGHAHVEVRPLIDLTAEAAVDEYPHPADMVERGRLRNPVEVFPHACRSSRGADSDHPDPYRPNGPPGQTRDTNQAPLGRTSHRAKTHLGYRVRQVGLGCYEWETPHGLRRLVDPTGTREAPLPTGTDEDLATMVRLLEAARAARSEHRPRT